MGEDGMDGVDGMDGEDDMGCQQGEDLAWPWAPEHEPTPDEWAKESIRRLAIEAKSIAWHWERDEREQAAFHIENMREGCQRTFTHIVHNCLPMDVGVEVLRQVIETHHGQPYRAVEVPGVGVAFVAEGIEVPDTIEGLEGMGGTGE